MVLVTCGQSMSLIRTVMPSRPTVLLFRWFKISLPGLLGLSSGWHTFHFMRDFYLFLLFKTRDGENESRSLSHTFYLLGLSGNLQEPDLHFTQEITFGRFAQMLRSFASIFDKIER